MKRCPQCEFIYEDHQSLCDMDGQSLVHDHASVIQPWTSAQTKAARPSSLNGIALPAGAGLLLALAIFIGYTASPSSLQTKTEGATAQPTTQQFDTDSPRQNNLSIQSTGAVSALESATPEPSERVTTTKPERNAIADKAAHARLEKGDERFPIARSVPPLPRLRPLPRLPDAKPLEKKPNSTGIGRTPERSRQPKQESATTGKKDSKLGSFLKKTGRVLSKPFRL